MDVVQGIGSCRHGKKEEGLRDGGFEARKKDELNRKKWVFCELSKLEKKILRIIRVFESGCRDDQRGWAERVDCSRLKVGVWSSSKSFC